MSHFLLMYKFALSSNKVNMEKLSAYAKNLPQEAKKQYSEKISMIENIDPFNLFREPVSMQCPASPAMQPTIGRCQ